LTRRPASRTLNSVEPYHPIRRIVSTSRTEWRGRPGTRRADVLARHGDTPATVDPFDSMMAEVRRDFDAARTRRTSSSELFT
jgi:hypothetical protein